MLSTIRNVLKIELMKESYRYFWYTAALFFLVSIMECRLHCGACCIAPSISSSFPLHPNGKAAGERCKNLSDDNLCKLFGQPERPAVCHDFKAVEWACGKTSADAMAILTEMEELTG